MNPEASMDCIALSGGFDPPHTGHLRYIRAAARFGPVIIFLNSDEWLIKKKGYSFMDFDSRREMLLAMPGVVGVEGAIEDEKGTVIDSIKKNVLKIKAFGKGGDRIETNTPEVEICHKLGIPIIFGLGGPKIQSSSELVKNAWVNRETV